MGEGLRVREIDNDEGQQLVRIIRRGSGSLVTRRRLRRWRSPAGTSKPTGHDLPFSTWSLSKLADFLVAEGVVDDISHEGRRMLLRREGVTVQRLKTWKPSKDPRYAANKLMPLDITC